MALLAWLGLIDELENMVGTLVSDCECLMALQA